MHSTLYNGRKIAYGDMEIDTRLIYSREAKKQKREKGKGKREKGDLRT